MLSIIVPTYNERGNILHLIALLEAVVENAHEIIVVDDNSPDGTADAVLKASKKFPSVKLLKREGKMGLSSAIMAGVSAAKGEYVVVMDADLSHPPELVPKMAVALKGCDLVIGSRMLPGGGVKSWPLHRRLISSGAELLARLAVGVKVSDPLSGFFAMRQDAFAATRVRTKGYKILLNILADNRQLKIREIPYLFQDRAAGETKLGAGEVAQYLADLFTLRFRRPSAKP